MKINFQWIKFQKEWKKASPSKFSKQFLRLTQRRSLNHLRYLKIYQQTHMQIGVTMYG